MNSLINYQEDASDLISSMGPHDDGDDDQQDHTDDPICNIQTSLYNNNVQVYKKAPWDCKFFHVRPER